jgi:hypothetical protein
MKASVGTEPTGHFYNNFGDTLFISDVAPTFSAL